MGRGDALQVDHLHHRFHLTTFRFISGTVLSGLLADNLCDGVCKYWPTLGSRTARPGGHSLGILSDRTFILTVQEQAELTTV